MSTRAPVLSAETPAPTSATVPATSCPRMIGGGGKGRGAVVDVVQVGVADAAAGHSHQHLAGLRFRRGDFFQFERLVRGVEDGGLHAGLRV